MCKWQTHLVLSLIWKRKRIYAVCLYVLLMLGSWDVMNLDQKMFISCELSCVFV